MKTTVDDADYFRLSLDEADLEIEQLQKSLSLVQCLATTWMNKCATKWKEGHTAGSKEAGFEYDKVHAMFQKLRKERDDDNATFTAEIMKLEDSLMYVNLKPCPQCEAAESEVVRLRSALERIASEVGTSTLAHKIAQEALKDDKTPPLN